mgnify:CR=1 FL=1
MARCCAKVFDKISHKKRNCLCKAKWTKYCSNHARKFVIKIQAAWRSYICRRRINVFRLLPKDVWEVILDKILFKDNVCNLYDSHAHIYWKRNEKLEEEYQWEVRTGYYNGYNRTANIRNRIRQNECNIVYFNKLAGY